VPDEAALARRRLIELLRRAYSGELAAAEAYAGHWRSLRDPLQRERVREIEADEWRHREIVAGMLRELGGRPAALRDARAGLIGKTLGWLCRYAGWLAPMWGAGLLEADNVDQYRRAAGLAQACDREDFESALLEMAQVEDDHERYFRERVASHRLAALVPHWRLRASRS
jgi:demethoxyubiquinone hydroxylase (CLK1/Coq7/Cat5 family)